MENQTNQSGNSSGANTVLIVIVIILLLGGGYWWYTNRGGPAKEGITVDVNLPSGGNDNTSGQ